jgi:hypothetical protein
MLVGALGDGNDRGQLGGAIEHGPKIGKIALRRRVVAGAVANRLVAPQSRKCAARVSAISPSAC